MLGDCKRHGGEICPRAGPAGLLEGLAPRQPGLQDIEIWAESDSGARGHLQCSVQIRYFSETCARLLLVPYFAQLLGSYAIRTLPERYTARYHGCRRCQNG